MPSGLQNHLPHRSALRRGWAVSFIVAALFVGPVVWAQTPEPEPPAESPIPEPSKNDAPVDTVANEAAVVDEAAVFDPRVPVRSRAASLSGATGVETVLSADRGPLGTIRLRLGLDWFETEGFLDVDDTNTFTASTLSLSWTPIDDVEVFGAIRNTSNVNEGGRPSLLQTQGDAALGVKAGLEVNEWYAAAVAGSLAFVSGVGAEGFAGDGTSGHIRAISTIDLYRELDIPFRFHADIGYYVENSEDAVQTGADDLDIVQEFGFQIARNDRVPIGFGFEFPFSPYVTPWLEYRLDVPLEVELSRAVDTTSDLAAVGPEEFRFGSFPHWVTPGVRVFPLEELAFDAAVRIGLAQREYPGVPATPPWRLVIALSYTLDPRPEVVEREIVKTIEVAPETPPAPPPPAEGTVAGRVVSSPGGAPVADARIAYANGRSVQLGDAQGRFGSYVLPEGKVKLTVSAERYLPSTVEVEVIAGKATPLDIELRPDPSKQPGTLVVVVNDAKGRPIDARISVGEPANRSGMTGPDGRFSFEVLPGTYPITVTADGLPSETRDATVQANRESRLVVALAKAVRAKRALVVVRKNSIQVRRKIHFVKASAKLLPDSRSILGEVARVLAANPEIKKLRIDGHTDNRGDRTKNVKLSLDRAEAVRSYLIKQGVNSSRLSVKGFGPDKPQAPNLTSTGREKNRRVEFRILLRS